MKHNNQLSLYLDVGFCKRDMPTRVQQMHDTYVLETKGPRSRRPKKKQDIPRPGPERRNTSHITTNRSTSSSKSSTGQAIPKSKIHLSCIKRRTHNENTYSLPGGGRQCGSEHHHRNRNSSTEKSDSGHAEYAAAAVVSVDGDTHACMHACMYVCA